MEKEKVVIIGDGLVGKTCLLETFTTGVFPAEYEPTVFDTKSYTLVDGKKSTVLHLWDSAGQEDFARLRKLTYKGAKCFVLCYAVHKPITLQHCKSKWLPEITEANGRLNVPLILVGNQCDIRSTGRECTTPSDGKRMKRLIGATDFVECSAKENVNVSKVFLMAARAINKFNKNGGRGPCVCCALL